MKIKNKQLKKKIKNIKESFEKTKLDYNNSKNKDKNKDKKKTIGKKITYQILWALLIITGIIIIFSGGTKNNNENNISISELANLINQNEIKEILIERDNLKIETIAGEKLFSKKEAQGTLSETLISLGVTTTYLQKVNIKPQKPTGAGYYLGVMAPFFFPLLILGLLIYFLTRGSKSGGAMQAFSFGSSRAKFIDPKDDKNRITFKDVAGANEAKDELREVVDFLKKPEKYLKIGAEIPKGVIMLGAPGTGKTLLARAVAGEAQVPFYSVSGSDFMEMFVGVGASRVRDLFKTAKKTAPSIIFIDEIDVIGRVRGGGMGGGNDEREQTLNQILVEMDGFEKNQKIIVIAATNRHDVLDPALIRPGRFDRRVTIDLPDKENRKKILEVHARGKPFIEDVDLGVIAMRTPGFSGADLQALMNESAILAASSNRTKIAQIDLIQSIEKVLLGPERKSHILSAQEKVRTAYHEVGHALVASLLDHADPIHKISVISRGRAAGYTLHMPFNDKKMHTRKDFIADITTILGGYVTEKMVFGDVTTGPSNDLQVSTKLARDMVTKYGMSEKVGVLALEEQYRGVLQGSGDGVKDGKYSEKIGNLIDQEVSNIMSTSFKLAEKLLKTNKKALIGISEELYEKEVLEREEFEKLLEKYNIRVKKEEDELERFEVFGNKFDFKKKNALNKKEENKQKEKTSKKITKRLVTK